MTTQVLREQLLGAIQEQIKALAGEPDIDRLKILKELNRLWATDIREREVELSTHRLGLQRDRFTLEAGRVLFADLIQRRQYVALSSPQLMPERMLGVPKESE